MEQKRKYPIRQVSITNMTKFLNLLAGKTYRSNEIVELSKEYHIRANFLSYAKQMNYCKKDESGAYFFLDRLFDPIHAKHLIEVSNKYNNEVLAKKKRRLEEKQNDLTNLEIENEMNEYEENNNLDKISKLGQRLNTEETHFHHRNLLELQISALKSENVNLEYEVSDLLDANANLKKSAINLEKEVNDLYSTKANLKKSLDYCNEEIRGLNDIIWNNNNNESLQKENDLLKEKISSLEKLVSIYFK
jgi:predicted  nucleic acid-binding Zn-ribbon protein